MLVASKKTRDPVSLRSIEALSLSARARSKELKLRNQRSIQSTASERLWPRDDLAADGLPRKCDRPTRQESPGRISKCRRSVSGDIWHFMTGSRCEPERL